MTVLSVIKDVCATVGVLIPQSVFSSISGNRTMQEMLSLANEMAQRIAYDTRDWTRLRTTMSYTGDGVTTEHILPANYKRMLLTSGVWRSTSTTGPMRFVPDTDDWFNRRARNVNTSSGEWTIMGGKLHIFPALAAAIDAVPAETAYFAYLDKNCIALNSGGYGDAFLNDLDTFVLDERLLKLGMIWQWMAQKGGPYAEAMGNYGDALTISMGHDSPAPIIVGTLPISATTGATYSGAMP